MNKTLIGLTLALGLGGCAAGALQNFNRNLAAADCSTPASEQAFLDNLPPNPFVTAGQQKAILQQACLGLFGTVAAPLTAPGNEPALPAAVPPAPLAPTPPAASK